MSSSLYHNQPGLFLQCFLNQSRPPLVHPSVVDIPINILGPATSSQLTITLTVDPRNSTECASSARYWESLLEDHRIPYLLLRVADMRYVLESKVTALLLYEELQDRLRDSNLEEWIQQTKSSLTSKIQKRLRTYKTSSLAQNPAQVWRSIKTGPPSFPLCAIPAHDLQNLANTWSNLRMQGPNAMMAKFLNLTALETNFLEGMFQLPPEVASTLVQVGFLHQVPIIGEDGITGGAVRSGVVALSILRDTRKTLNWILNSNPSEITLTLETLCRVHETLMHSSRVLNIHTKSMNSVSTSPSGSPGSQSQSDTRETRLRYVNVGITRQTTCLNLTGYKLGVKSQFCPHDKVNGELKVFCKLYNELIRRDDIDPFAAAAWISHAFLMIHPFEDGNNRLSRVLASVPLVAKGFPPLCVPYSLKNTYLSLLNGMREDPDCQELMSHLYEGMKASLDLLRNV